jgi:hypothetical protein
MRCFVNLCGTMGIFSNIVHFLFKKSLVKKVALETLTAVHCTVKISLIKNILFGNL